MNLGRRHRSTGIEPLVVRAAAHGGVSIAVWAIACVVFFLPATGSWAHPFDATYYSARAAVEAEADGVRIQVVVEVPTARILEHFLELYGDPTQLDDEANEIFRQRQFERFAEDLRVRLAGRRITGQWRPAATEANGRGTEEFFAYFLDFEADDPTVWQAERLDLRIDLEMFAREYLYLSASIDARPPWQVLTNSAEPILSRSTDDLFDPATGQWSVDPRLRNLRFVLERALPAPGQADTGQADAGQADAGPASPSESGF